MLAMFLLIPSCGDDGTPGDKCESASDCQTGQICAGGTCAACQSDVQCTADYGADFTCVDGACVSSSCTPGELGCTCLTDGSCSAGECVSGVCTDCQRGTEDCVCYDNNTCDAGYRCNAQGICEVCPEGEEGCPCRSDGSCDGELTCEGGLCIAAPCPQGTEGCPCREDGSCDSGLYCLGSGLCSPCSNDIVDCPCESGECINDLVCDQDSDLCREALTCADISCVPHQLCEEAVGGDAVCLESCESGYVWDPSMGSCLEATCVADVAGSIAATCEAENRVCVEQTPGAICSDCLPFFIDENGSLQVCRPVDTCEILDCAGQNRECTAETETSDAECGECYVGYTDDGVECVLANCEEGTNGSIVEICAEENRLCEELGQGAVCGQCMDGFAENAQGECQQASTCEELQCAVKNRLCEGEDPFRYCGASRSASMTFRVLNACHFTSVAPGKPTQVRMKSLIAYLAEV
jgi:hypothetical protein